MNKLSDLSIAQALIESGNYSEAVSIMEPLCESGVVDAINMLGNIYQLTARNEAEGKKAVALLSQAAGMGSGLAAHNLATVFATGLPGVPVNLEESRLCLRQAKNLGVELLPKNFYE